MKIILFLNNDIHAATALRHLLPTLKQHDFRIILSQKVGNITGLPQELIEMGRIERDGVKKFLDKAKSSSESGSHSENKVTNHSGSDHKHLPALAAGSITSHLDINSDEAIADLKNFAPDLFISIRFGQIFKQPLINIPRHGVLNLHSGILPDYRGVMASFWAILNGAKKLGTTLHYISDSGIDTGEIISFSESEIDPNSSLVLNINHLYQAGCGLITQALEKISAGEKITTIDQKTLGDGGYFSYPKEGDVKKFLALMPLVRDGDLDRI